MASRCDDPGPEYVPLTEAVRRTGRSVRTVQRWVEEGLVDTVPHPTDRRRRLLSAASLDRVIGRWPQTLEDARAAHERAAAADRAAIERLAGELDARTVRAVGALGLDRDPSPRDERLRNSQFVADLTRLVRVVRGEANEPPDVVQRLLEDVLVALYDDPAGVDVAVPESFWRENPVGRHLARANLLLHPPDRLISLYELVAVLGLPQRRVEVILGRLGVGRLYDPDEGRWLYPRWTAAAVRDWAEGRETDSWRMPAGPAESPEIGSAPEPAVPPENRRDFRLARAAYHRRYFPQPKRQRRQRRSDGAQGEDAAAGPA